MFWIGVLVGAVGMFFGLFLLGRLARWAVNRNKTHTSSVKIIEKDGSEKTITKTRKPEKWDGPNQKNMGGENSIESVGENVHAVLRRG